MWRFFLTVAALAADPAPSLAQSYAVDVFEDLCVGEQIFNNPAFLSRRFRKAIRVEFLPHKSRLDELARREDWLLNPDAPEDEHLVLVIGAADAQEGHEIGICIIFAAALDEFDAQADLLDRGAEYEGKYLFMNGPKRVWDIQFFQERIGGPTLIFGRTNSYPKERGSE